MARVVYQLFVGAFGDIDGVGAHLAHVAALGADAVYLTPIFAAPSPHMYDTIDYDRIDPAFGGEAAFDRLVAGCRAHGLGLILDGVFNHVGDAHVWRRAHPDWFTGADWRGYPSLRELDTANPTVRRACADVVARWTARGATGWRLDCANDLGVPFAGELARAARDAGAVDGVIGEVMGYGAGWARDGGLDGVMNYWLRAAALALASSSAPAGTIQRALDRLAAESDAGALQRSWSLVGSHDTARLATALDDDRARIRLALALAFAYPGVPMIYYGDELGLHAAGDPDNRRPLPPPSTWDQTRRAFVAALCALRKREPALDHGRYVSLAQPGSDLVAFSRGTDAPSETLIFVANATPRPLTRTLFVPLPLMFDALPMHDLLDGSSTPVHVASGTLTLTLPPHGCVLLRPRDAHVGGYRFFKPVLGFAQ
ncbi:MAG TPA: alpha-amylase family glycosyl hydrolase [Polyangia bacterium]